MKKIVKSTIKGLKRLLLCGLAAALPASAQVAFYDAGTQTPSPGVNDISQLSTAGDKGGSPAGLNYYSNGAGPGETFKTGSNAAGYLLTNLFVLTDTQGGGTGNGVGQQTYYIYIYQLPTASSTTASLVATYKSAATFSYNQGDWLQISNISTVLAPNTTYAYAFDNSGNGWDDLATASPHPYANGQVVCIAQNSTTVQYSSGSTVYNGVFDIGLIPIPNSAPPVITAAPASSTETLGRPVSLSVTAGAATTYQWMAAATNSSVYTNLSNGTIYSGVTTPTLTISNFNAGNVGKYVVVVGNANGSVTNDGINGDAAPATLTLSSNLLDNAQFILPGTGKITTGYATVPGWADTAAAAGYTDTGVETLQNPIADPNFTSGFEAYVEANQGGGYQLSYYQAQPGDAIVLTWWANAEYVGGNNIPTQFVSLIEATAQTNAYSQVSLAVTNITYQGSVGSGYIKHSLIYYVQSADVGKNFGASFWATNAGSVTGGGSYSGFNDFNLTVVPASAPPQLVSDITPLNPIGASGEPFTFSAQFSGGQPITYQWQVNTGSGFVNIPGATSSSVTLPALTYANSGSIYQVVAHNAYGTLTSSASTLTVGQPVIGVQFEGNGGNSTALTPGETAGYVSQGNWNVDALASLGTFTNVVDNAANPTPTTVAVTYANGQYHTGDNITDGDGVLMSGGFWSGGNYTVKVTGVPYATYDVYVYVLNDNNPNRRYGLTLGNQTYWGSVFNGNTYSAPPFTLATQTTELPEGSQQQADVVQFLNVSGSSFTIEGQTPDGNIALMGIQIFDAAGGPPVAGPIDLATNAVFSGQPVVLSEIPVAGQTPLKFQWLTDGGSGGALTNIPAATNSTFTINTTPLNGNYNYEVIISNSLGSSTSAVQQVTVTAGPPVLATDITQTSGSEVYVGGTVTYSAAYVGALPISYQWLFNGNPLAGATNSTLVLNNVQLASAGTYQLAATNIYSAANGGPTYSSSSTLTVLADPSAPAAGSYASDVLASGPVALWPFNELGNPTSGALPFYDATGHNYDGVFGSAALNGFNGIAGPQSPAFPGFPANNTALQTSGGSLNSWAVAPPLNLNTNTVTIAAWISTASGQNPDAGIVFQRSGTTTAGLNLFSDGATLGFDWNANGTAENWNSDITLDESGAWTLVALVVTPSSATIYQYNANGTESATLPVANANQAFAGSTYIGNDPGDPTGGRTFGGSISSVSIWNTALTPGQIAKLYTEGSGQTVAPYFTVQPVSQSNYIGQTIEFTAPVGGSGTLTYQWYFNNAPLSNGGGVSGATSATLILSNVTVAAEGNYYVTASSTGNPTLTSQTASLALFPGSPIVWAPTNAITTADALLDQPGNLVGAVVFGGTSEIVTLTNGKSVDFVADGPLASVNGNGQNNNAYVGVATTGNTALDDVLTQYSYDGGPKTITLNNLLTGHQYGVLLVGLDDINGFNPPREAYFQDPYVTTDVSDTFLMTANVYVTGTFTAGTTTENIIEQLPVGGNGNLNAVVLWDLTPLPGISLEPQSETAYPGQTVTLTGAGYGAAPLSYQWLFNGAPLANSATVSGATSTNLTLASLTTAEAGNYAIVVSNSGGSITSSPAILTLLPLSDRGVSVQFQGNGPALASNQVAGLVPFDNWNVEDQNSGGTATNLVDSEGLPLTTTVTVTGYNHYDTGDNASTPDGILFSGGFWTQSGTPSVNVTGVPYGAYNVYFYILNDNNPGRRYSLTLGTQTYWGEVFSGSGDVIPPFIQATTTTDAGAGNDPQANYVEFTNITGSSFTINGTVPDGTVAYMGIQIVNTPYVFVPPVIVSQSSSETVYAGQTANLSAVVSGGAYSYYQWQQNGVNLSNGGNLSGASTNALTISSVTAANAGNYTLIVTNIAGQVTSQPITLTVLPAPAAGSYAAAVLANNPLAYWPLNETSGTVAYDYAGGYNGSYIGSVTLGQAGPTGYFGANDYSPLFDGSSSYVDVPEGPFNITGAITIMAWVNFPNTLGHYADVIGHGDTSWRIAMDTAGDASANDDGPNDANTGNPIVGTGWHLLAYTYTGVPGVNNNGALYVDGALQGNDTITTTPAGSGYDVWIAGAPDYGLNRLLNGNVAQVAIFTTALTANQVLSLYTEGTQPPSVTLSIAPASNGSITITWSGGTLLQATNLLGPWVPNTAATSPYTTGATNAQTFFQVQP